MSSHRSRQLLAHLISFTSSFFPVSHYISRSVLTQRGYPAVHTSPAVTPLFSSHTLLAYIRSFSFPGSMGSKPSEAVLFEFSQKMSSTNAARRLQQRREKRASMLSNGRSSSRIPVAVTVKPNQTRRPSLYDLRPTSVGCLRRSVSGMKRLLPLRLASPEPEIYTSPSTEVHNSFGLVYHRKQDSTAATVVPWMQTTQEVPLLGELHPNMYRETPIYSASKSPAVARAYFSEEDVCLNCEPPGSPCEELCIVDSYLSEDPDSSISANDFAECVESFDDRSTVESEMTSNTECSSAWESSRYSELSIKCCGEKYGKREAVWYKNPAPVNSYFAPPFKEDELLVGRLDENSQYINHGASRCSSAASTTQIFDVSFLTLLSIAITPMRWVYDRSHC